MAQMDLAKARTIAKALRDTRKEEGPEQGTLEFALWTCEVILHAFYDNVDAEPEIAVRDLLTDLAHYTGLRDIDLDDAIQGGKDVAEMEAEEWAVGIS
jgi:hypothetical protein